MWIAIFAMRNQNKHTTNTQSQIMANLYVFRDLLNDFSFYSSFRWILLFSVSIQLILCHKWPQKRKQYCLQNNVSVLFFTTQTRILFSLQQSTDANSNVSYFFRSFDFISDLTHFCAFISTARLLISRGFAWQIDMCWNSCS